MELVHPWLLEKERCLVQYPHQEVFSPWWSFRYGVLEAVRVVLSPEGQWKSRFRYGQPVVCDVPFGPVNELSRIQKLS